MGISTISQSQIPTSSATLSFEDIKDNLCNPKNWYYLIPTVGAITLGILFAPNFSIGLAAGGAIWFVATTISATLATCGFANLDDRNSEYMKTLFGFPLLATFFAPVGEELVFRGAIQPLLTRAIVWLVPAATAAFFGTGLGIATTVSIVATAAIFGFIHTFNKHKNSHIQALVTGVQGIAFGVLAAQFGLGASIAAHMMVNTILFTLGRLVYKEPPETTATGSQSRSGA
jgi:membrane protease YdiL (CAAX protease family)